MEEIKVPHLPINDSNYLDFEGMLDATDKPDNFVVDDILDNRNIDRNDPIKYIALILQGMGMGKYLEVFVNENVDLDSFLNLKEQDLIELGITDKKDREVILRNLKAHQSTTEEFKVLENHEEDLRIAKNVYNEVMLMQNYCAYIGFQLKKHKLTDYRVSGTETAAKYLKMLTEYTLTQADIMSKALYQSSGADHLIGKALDKTNLTLPKHLQDKLAVKKVKKRKTVLKIAVVVGVSSMMLLVAKYLLNKK